MTGRHAMPTEVRRAIRRPPVEYPRYTGPWIAVAAVNGVVLVFGAVFAVGTTVAPRVHATAREAVTAGDTLSAPVSPLTVQMAQGDPTGTGTPSQRHTEARRTTWRRPAPAATATTSPTATSFAATPRPPTAPSSASLTAPDPTTTSSSASVTPETPAPTTPSSASTAPETTTAAPTTDVLPTLPIEVTLP